MDPVATNAPPQAGPAAAASLAVHEGAFGLGGRARFLDELAAAASAGASQGGFAVLAVQTPGVQTEDADATSLPGRLAAVTAARLDVGCGIQACVARVGEGFAVRLPLPWPLDLPELLRRVHTLQATLRAPLWFEGCEFLPEVRIGIACFPQDGAQGADLLSRAEAAARVSAGQGGIAFHDAAVNAVLQRRWQLMLALPEAIEGGALELRYTPRVGLTEGQIVGAEVLPHWPRPEEDDVAAADVLQLAEEAGLGEHLADWLLRQACLQQAAWRRQGLGALRLAVPLGRGLLQPGTLAGRLQALLIETGADPAGLALELDTLTLDHRLESNRRCLRELKALGLEIVLDGFGDGPHGMQSLRQLPVDLVRIDRGYVHDVTAPPEAVSATRALVQMAHAMHLRVLASDVESEGQLGLLVVKGCDQFQGPWYSPPLTAADFGARLREDRRLPPQLCRRRAHERTLLLVDDEEHVIAALRRTLRREGYRIVSASGGEEGLLRLAEGPVDVILSDQRMPGMDGVAFLRRARDQYPDTVRMTLSGYTDLQSIIDAVNEGAIYKFLTKPWDDKRLRGHIAEAFRQKELADENRRLAEELAHANARHESLTRRLNTLLQEQQAQSERLAASATGARALLDALPVGVIGLDPEGMVAYVNQAAAQAVPQAAGALGQPAAQTLPGVLGRCHCTEPTAHALRLGSADYLLLCQTLNGNTEMPERGHLLLLLPQTLPASTRQPHGTRTASSA